SLARRASAWRLGGGTQLSLVRPGRVRQSGGHVDPLRPQDLTVLVVDDEPDLRDLVDFNLRQAGYKTRVADGGGAALAACAAARPDILILDLNLPDVSGIEVCRSLRAGATTRDLPILMLTARGGEVDRVVGFEVGADDYVTKPFSVRELVLRV